MPRHSTSLLGSGLRARMAPAVYSGSRGTCVGSGFKRGSSAGATPAQEKWRDEVEAYRSKHGCSFKVALSGASAARRR